MTLLHKSSFCAYFDGTLLAHIMQKNNDEILFILQDATDPCQLVSDIFGNTLLHYAAKYGNNGFAQHLIDLGALVDVPNGKKRTPLFSAVSGGQEDTAKLLVEANANMFVPDDRGQCPLGRAFTHQLYIAISLLDKLTVDSLKNNIEYVKSQEFHLDCKLYHFIRLKNVEITRLLLECGSPVNAKNRLHHETALHLAAEQLDLENVKLLLEYGADVNAKNCLGETPLARIPVEKGFQHSKERDEADNKALAIVKALLGAGAVLTDSASKKLMPRWLLMYGNREMVRAVLQAQIDLKFVDEFNETGLHVLAYNKHPDILEVVQDLQSSSKVRSIYGYTMLHRAAGSGNVSGIKHLLNSGADVNAEDNFRDTPLGTVFSTTWFADKGDGTMNDYLLSIEILLEHGAHPRLKTSSWENHRFKDEYDLLRKPVVAHIAVLEASGRAVERSLHNTIESRYAYQKTFNSMKKLLADMKQIMIGESVTLLDFLIASDEKISLYARRERSIITNLTKHVEKDSLDSYYRRVLMKKYMKLSQLVETRKKVALAMNDFFNRLYDISVYFVAEKIVNYLEDPELYRLLPIIE